MENIKDRELRIITTVKAAIAIVWKVWTEAEHIVNWWGPKGHTNTIHKMDFTEGGEWKLTMEGPDGKKYPNRSLYKEIIPFRKIVMEHFNPHFIATILFEEKDEETEIDWSLLFDTAADYNIIVKTFKADEGLNQNIEKLESYLAEIENR